MPIIDAPYGLRCDPEAGVVYGRRGRPVGFSNSRGYLQVDVKRRNLGIVAPFAHRVVWESVYGPIPDGYEINHVNGIKTDNRLSNLELTTRSGNVRHAYATGLKSNRGESHPRHRLSEEDVRSIRRRYKPGLATAFAAEFGVTSNHITQIIRGVAWRHSVEVE